jgi:hypothetical protein
MHILGVDFTSAPSARKPITCAVCELDGTLLRLGDLRPVPDFAAFERLLCEPGPWLGGFDFPFGLPRQVVRALGWPEQWAEYMLHIRSLGKPGFEAALSAYKAARPSGQKEPPRATDIPARSRSSLKLFNPPVAKMLFQGAPRLLEAGLSILPCHPGGATRVALETYPALLTRALASGRPYKHDDRRRQTLEQHEARRAIVEALRGPALHERYGLHLHLAGAQAESLCANPSGDQLDALLCAVQAAWAYRHRDAGYGIPADCDPLEGWIVDPAQWLS